MGAVLGAFLASLAASSAGAQALCPAGTRRAAGACVKDDASAWQPPALAEPAPAPPAAGPPAGSCAAFNARVTGFLARQTGAYSRLGTDHADLEASIDREVQRDRELELSLRRQAMWARDPRVRWMLLSQARAAGGAAAGAQARLRSAVRADRSVEERFKDVYKIEARALLARRPAGCAVTAAR